MTRPIRATFHRKGDTFRERAYTKIDNAIPRCVQVLMRDGRPGDVVEFHHAVTGMQIGTVKVKVGGKISTWFVWEDVK